MLGILATPELWLSGSVLKKVFNHLLNNGILWPDSVKTSPFHPQPSDLLALWFLAECLGLLVRAKLAPAALGEAEPHSPESLTLHTQPSGFRRALKSGI